MAMREPPQASQDGVQLGGVERPGVPTVRADAVALCHCFIRVLLRHLRPAIRRKILEMTSVAEASSAAP